jgi:hypothetical protein
MKKCKNAKDYNGIYPPKCDGGKGCDTCREIFQSRCHHPVDYLEGGQSLGDPIKCGRCGCVIEVNDRLIMAKLVELVRYLDNLRDDVRSLESKIDMDNSYG